jgi:alkane 1-monooxygenase
MGKFKYFGVYTIPLVVFMSLNFQEGYTFFALFVVFGFIPFIELFTQGSTHNLCEIQEKWLEQDRFFDFLLYSLLPIQYFLGVYYLQQISLESTSLVTKWGMTTAFGISCGVLGINAAHELGHRHTANEQWMSKLLLLSTLYMHFFIEHNRGHHRHVATPEDPASARRNESVYAFYIRSIFGSWISAWKLEVDRLKNLNISAFSLRNEMLLFSFLQLTLLLSIFFFFGVQTFLFFIVSAVIGILLLETVNYIEHYGLQRKLKSSNRYERTLPAHSWNSNHPIGRILLLELSRHSDHHYLSTRKFQILRHFDESPQMPTGYPGMMLLALFPPLWFKIMHLQIQNIGNNATSGQCLKNTLNV